MADTIEITDEMRAVVGIPSMPWTFEVTTTSVRAFARGVGYTDPVYYDEPAARAAGYRSLPCPPTYLGTPVFIPGKSSDTLSVPIDTARVNHGLSNILDGGTETEYFADVCAGDRLSVSSSISDLSVKTGRATGQMLVVTLTTTYTNQDGVVVALQRAQELYY